MNEWMHVVLVAFGAQLAALPGEKGQIVIGGLATKYDPYVVVAGAATAFGGWTVVEILLGSAIQGALPEVYVDAATVILFVAFAIWILYTTGDPTPKTVDPGSPDGGTRLDHARQRSVSSRLWVFVSSFTLMVVGEIGDKTQLITIGLSAQYGATSAIWVGEMAAIVPVSLATSLFFHGTATRYGRSWFHRLSAAAFLLFALDLISKYVAGTTVLPL